MTKAPVSRRLAELIVSLSVHDLSDNAVRQAKTAVLDQLGIMLMGTTLPWTRPVIDVARRMQTRPESTVIGLGDKLSSLDAAVVNANLGHSCEFDDSGFDGGAHSGALTVAPALALCESLNRSGQELILAVVTGYEILHRIGRVMSRSLLDIGFHHQGVIGPFGAATVAGKILGLDVDQMTHCLAVTASHSSGTMEYDQRGGEVKRYHSAMAVRAGMTSALLAQAGLTGPDTIFEGRRGIVPLFARVDNALDIATELSDPPWYAIEGRTIKPFPAAGTTHTSIQAIDRLAHDHGFHPEDVDRIDVIVDPYILLHGAAVQYPTDTISAQFSLAFSVALRLVTGTNDLRHYLDETMWTDPRITSVISKVHVHGRQDDGGDRPDWGTIQGARVSVTLTSGQVHETVELHRKGSTKNPLTDDELHEKFRRLATSRLDQSRADAVIAAVAQLDTARDVHDIIRLCTAGQLEQEDSAAGMTPV